MSIPTEYNAKVIAHTTLTHTGTVKRNTDLITMVLDYPRFLLPEFNTHRSLVKNTSSSRAIPAQKSIDAVRKSAWTPEQFVAQSKGMTAKEYIRAEGKHNLCQRYWGEAAINAATSAQLLLDNGVHKQHVNRLLEPFLFTSQVLTGCRWAWEHFFALRYHEAAQPEMQHIAGLALQALRESEPEEGLIHLPFTYGEEDTYDAHTYREMGLAFKDAFPEVFNKLVDESLNQIERKGLVKLMLVGRLIVSIARTARGSYINFYGKQDPEKDWDLFYKLICEHPPHSSPSEHQAIFNREQIKGPLEPWSSGRALLSLAGLMEDCIPFDIDNAFENHD